MHADPALIAYLALCLAAGGFTKGVAGIGLPVIAVPFMALAVDLKIAVALMPVSIIGSNIVNAWGVRRNPASLKRFWPILIAMPLGVAWGASLLNSADPDALKAVVGATVIVFVAMQLAKPDWRLSDAAAFWLSPVAGLLAGLLGGITSINAPPMVMFLLAARLEKEDFVATISVFYILGMVVLAAFLTSYRIFDLTMLGWSAAAFGPVLAGQLAGAWARRRVSERVFRNIVYAVLLCAGVTMLATALR